MANSRWIIPLLIAMLVSTAPAFAQTMNFFDPPFEIARTIARQEALPTPQPLDTLGGTALDTLGGQPLDTLGGTACEICGSYAEPCRCACPPTRLVRVEAMFLTRDIGDKIKFVESRPDTSGGGPSLSRGEQATVLSTCDFDFDYAWGPRITLGTCNDCRTIEVTYFGLHQWRDSLTISSTDENLDVPFDSNLTSDFDDADFISTFYDSRLHSLEVNWLKTHDRFMTTVLGIRYWYLDEGFNIQSTDINGTTDTSNYLIDTSNHLAGLQVGGMLHGQQARRFAWNVAGKAGVYANVAQQHTLLRDNNNTVLLRDFTTSGGDVAFIGELSLNFIYHITNRVSMTAGYQGMWLEGVALAPEQLDFTTTATSGSLLNTNGGLFYHGGFIGLAMLF